MLCPKRHRFFGPVSRSAINEYQVADARTLQRPKRDGHLAQPAVIYESSPCATPRNGFSIEMTYTPFLSKDDHEK